MGATGEPAAVLAPLAARYGRWLGMDADQVLADRDEAAEDIRSMPLILRMERADPPVWSAALTLSCRAATALCLDERSAVEGPWHSAIEQYCTAHIRKVTRRARGAQWDAVGDLAGITLTLGGTQVRALLPGPVDELDKRVSRLQVGGTDVPVDLPVADEIRVESAGTLALWIPAHIAMTAGKMMAQTGHAGMISAALLSVGDSGALTRWLAAGLPVSLQRLSEWAWSGALVAAGDAERGWGQRLVAVRDAGFTEIEPGTVTVIADASGL